MVYPMSWRGPRFQGLAGRREKRGANTRQGMGSKPGDAGLGVGE